MGCAAYLQARTTAVADAVRRARDYASAVGSGLAGLVELADAHLLSESRGTGEVRAVVEAPDLAAVRA